MIYTENKKELPVCGSYDVIVAGSAVYKNDVTANVKEFLEIFKEYEGA